MRLLFLDIDGVLNDHTKTQSGYCSIQSDKVDHLNYILNQVPDLQIVISSSWRYLMLSNDITINGFEYLLLVFGVQARGRIHGCTMADGTELGVYDPSEGNDDAWREMGLVWRREGCHEYARHCGVSNFVILDDLDLESDHLVQTDGSVGLTREIADEVIHRFTNDYGLIPKRGESAMGGDLSLPRELR
jgi:hypothetical protein